VFNVRGTLKFLSQNCQSLNISTKCKKTHLKILALTKTNADVICISDIRLNSIVQIAAINDLVKKFSFNGYDLHYNSPYANRGVGILIRSNLGITITTQKRTGPVIYCC
jgi:exonuclease III